MGTRGLLMGAGHIKALDTERMISIKEVEEHFTYEDCWIAIENEVYDVTSYLPNHPGGEFIMGTAGSDVTVVFNCYHYHMRKTVDAIKKPLKVGNLIEESPKMGAFWLDSAQEITKKMKDVPRKPWRAVWLWVMDMVIWWSTIYYANFCTSSQTPLWEVMIIFVLMKIWLQRVAGHCHMIGHMAYFNITLSQWAMKFMALSCSLTAVVYALPNGKMNMRKWLNKEREKAQYEYKGMSYRGPMEHQAIHHVKGSLLKDDACYRLLRDATGFRLRPDDPLKWFHKYQTWVGYLEMKYFFFDTFRVVQPVVEHYLRMSYTYIMNGLWYRSIDLLLAVFATLPYIAYAQWLPMMLYGWKGWLCTCVVHFIFIQTSCDMGIFTAQHVWDAMETEAEQAKDWGKANCETSITLSGTWWHPVCWGMGSANPSTLTYHLEHTMFPGMCYLNLHMITDILEEKAKKHGIKFNKMTNIHELNSWIGGLKQKYGPDAFLQSKKLA